MEATLVCWSCGAEKGIKIPAPPMFAFEIAGWANDVGWRGVIDMAHGRTAVFCSEQCVRDQTTKTGRLRARPKKPA